MNCHAKGKLIMPTPDPVTPLFSIKSYSVSDIDEWSSIAFLDSTKSELSDGTFLGFKELQDKYHNAVLYRSKISTAFAKYKGYFIKLFVEYFLADAKKSINSMPTEKYKFLSGGLTSLHNYPCLGMYKINNVLQDYKNNIKVPAVINLAHKLSCGKIIATYKGIKTRNASYDNYFWNINRRLFGFTDYGAWVEYQIDIAYQLNKIKLSVPLVSFKFINRHHKYVHKGDYYSIYQIANNAVDRANASNSIATGKLFADYWPGSVLVDDSIKVHNIPKHTLNGITDYVVKYVLFSTSQIAKNLRRDVLYSNKRFYAAKAEKLARYYNLILNYTQLAGVNKADMPLLNNPTPRQQLKYDIVNLPLAGFDLYSNQSLISKYNISIDKFRMQIDNLLKQGVDDSIDISSDEGKIIANRKSKNSSRKNVNSNNNDNINNRDNSRSSSSNQHRLRI
jgi:hypothetical protein